MKRDKNKKISTVHNSLLLPPVYGHLATKETWPFDGSDFIGGEMVWW